MNNAVVVDVNTSRKPQVIIAALKRTKGDQLVPTDDSNPLDDLSTLLEGVCTMIHALEQEGIRDSATSLKKCIEYITNGFADASYKAYIDEPDK